MSKIKIVHISQCAGGVDVYLRLLLSRLDKVKFENILVCSCDFHREDYEGIAQVIQIDMVNALSPLQDCKAIKVTRELLKELKPDVLYCHSSKAGGVGRLAAIGLGIPILYNPHGWAFNIRGAKKKALIYTLLERMLAHFTSRIVAISNYEKVTAIEKHIAPASKIQTIFSGVDLEGIRKQGEDSNLTRATLGINEDSWLIGMVGRITETKAPDIFVKVAEQVKKQIPNAEFIIVGDGDMRQQIEQQISDCGLSDSFHITGWVKNPVAYSKLFNQGMLLSRWEGFGLAVAEYMAQGIPVIATERQGLMDLITDHDNGLLVSVDDVGEAVEAVVKTYKDKSLRDEMIKKGTMRVSAFFDISRVVNEHERLIAKLASGGVKWESRNHLPIAANVLLERRAAA